MRRGATEPRDEWQAAWTGQVSVLSGWPGACTRSISGMTQTIELLGIQHQDVLAHLQSVEAGALAHDGANLADFAAYLEREVCQHFAIEEQALFPALARHLGRDQGPLAVMDAEHASFRELLSRLADAVRRDDRAAQRTHALAVIDLLRAHIRKEDHVLFPMAARLLSDAEQAEVNERAAALAGAARA
jgi:regulator of cell morphogenesis and NO signaling